MNFSLLSAFPDIFFWAYGIAGLIFMALSFLLRRLIPPKGSALTNLSTEAEYWNLPEAALEDFSHALERFNASVSFGFGLGSLLFSLVALLLLISPAWSRFCVFNVGTFNTVWLFICIIGASGGGIYAFHRLQSEARTERTSGPQRTLKDYRSPLFFLVPVVWLALSCTLVIAFHPVYLLPNNCPISHFSSTPWQWWFAYLWLGLTIVAIFTMEFILSQIASTHSPLVPSKLADPGALDDLFRSKIINTVQHLAFSQLLLFSISLPSVISDLYAFIPLFLFMPIFFANILSLQSSRGLGGKLTGWFWQKKRTT